MKPSPLVNVTDIRVAADRIAEQVRRTPLVEAAYGRAEAPLWLKAECLQATGSFKIRGATNAVLQLTPQGRAHGIVTHSSGNHAQAVARAATAAGVPATIVMPRLSPAVKIEATRASGGDVVLVDIAERVTAMEAIRAETGAELLAPFDDLRVIAGQGTVGLEIVEDLPAVATVLVPVSGGGLISGIAAAVKALRADARVIGVEPELAGDLAEGFARGEHVTWDSGRTGRTIADGLRVTGVGELNWRHIMELVDDVVTVTESEILDAMRTIVVESRLVCEPSGAVALAGYLRHTTTVGSGPAVAVVSGGNVDPALLAEVVTG